MKMAIGKAGEVAARLPVMSWLPTYPKRYLGGDVLAGLVVAALAIPQALGYSGIAGVPLLVGLYSIPLALVAYALLGSSPHLIVGPVSTVAVLSGSLVADLSHGNAESAVQLTSAMAIGAGIGLLIGGFTKVGWAAEFLSRPIVTGFVFGLVILIVLGEIPSLLGLPSAKGDVFARLWTIVTSLDDVTPLTALVGVGALAVLFLGARFASRVPWGLVVLVAAILLSTTWNLAEHGVAVVGYVPTGFPPIGLPDIGWGEVPRVAAGGFALGMVGLAEGLSAARMIAARDGYAINTNQELLASGAANIASGLSGGMGVAGSLSKTAAADRSGSRSQVTGMVAAVVAAVVILTLAGLLEPLPRTVLSAIVIQAVWGLMDVPALRRYRSIRRNDFNAAIGALLGVLILGPLYGLIAAVILAVFGLVYRSSRVDIEIMGKVPDEKAAWGSLRGHPERKTYDGLLVVRLDAPLFWANATEVIDRVLETVDRHPDTRIVLLDLEATSQLDSTSIDAMELLLHRLQEREIGLYLVRVFYRARRVLARAGFIERLGEDHMWHSISAGVRAARDAENLTAKPRAQFIDEPDDDSDDDEQDDTAEAAVLSEDEDDEDDDDEGSSPVGGYDDPRLRGGVVRKRHRASRWRPW